MSWFNDVKDDEKLKNLFVREYNNKHITDITQSPTLVNKILGNKNNMSLIEYAWRAHIYPLLISEFGYAASPYNILETSCSLDHSLVTPTMLGVATHTEANPENPTPMSQVLAAMFNWGYSKEIYRFDKNIVEAIKDSECKEFDGSIFSKLPFESFYIECEVGRFNGALITNYANSYKNKVLNIVLISNDYPNGNIDWYTKCIDYDETYILDNCIGYEEEIKNYLNLINFLSCKNAKIVGSEHKYVLNKKTNSKLVRAESRNYDVNVVFENENQRNIVYHYINEDESAGVIGHRHPHIRKAHWGKYWAYVRDSDNLIIRESAKEPVFHWIPPIFVNGKALQKPKIHVV